MWEPRTIPIVEPIVIGRSMSSGRSQPTIMHCVDNGDNSEYVVKLYGNLELGRHNLAREVLASDLATFFELRTPDIAFVNISSDFLNGLLGLPNLDEFSNSSGLNFGSKYITDARIFSPPITNSQLRYAARTYCFDLLAGNPDRRVGKPNLFDDGDEFILFDHEQCFPYSRPSMMIGGYPHGWEFILEMWHKNHILYSSCKGKDCLTEVQSFIEKLRELDDNTLSEMENRIPSEWYSDDLSNIRSYIIEIRDNSEIFMRSLQECFL